MLYLSLTRDSQQTDLVWWSLNLLNGESVAKADCAMLPNVAEQAAMRAWRNRPGCEVLCLAKFGH